MQHQQHHHQQVSTAANSGKGDLLHTVDRSTAANASASAASAAAAAALLAVRCPQCSHCFQLIDSLLAAAAAGAAAGGAADGASNNRDADQRRHHHQMEDLELRSTSVFAPQQRTQSLSDVETLQSLQSQQLSSPLSGRTTQQLLARHPDAATGDGKLISHEDETSTTGPAGGAVNPLDKLCQQLQREAVARGEPPNLSPPEQLRRHRQPRQQQQQQQQVTRTFQIVNSSVEQLERIITDPKDRRIRRISAVTGCAIELRSELAAGKFGAAKNYCVVRARTEASIDGCRCLLARQLGWSLVACRTVVGVATSAD